MRLSLRAIDQLVNSASSAVFSIGLVMVTDDAELGAIAIQMTALPVLLGLARTSVFESILFRLSAAEHAQASWIPIAGGLIGGLLALLVSLGLGVLVDLRIGQSLAFAVVTAAVLVFDGLRFSAFVADADSTAMRADLLWLLLTAVSIVLVASRTNVTADRLAWCYSSAAFLGCVGYGRLLRSTRIGAFPRKLIREFRFGADFLLQVAPGQIALAGAALVTSLGAIGSIRAAVTLFSPLATLVYAVRLTLIDRTMSDRRSSPTVVYAVIAAVYTVSLSLAFDVFSGPTSRLFGPLPMSVLALVGVGEIARHVTQALVDRSRAGDELRSALSTRSTQAITLVAASMLLAPTLADTGLAFARLVAFAGPLIVFRPGSRPLDEPHDGVTTRMQRD